MKFALGLLLALTSVNTSICMDATNKNTDANTLAVLSRPVQTPPAEGTLPDSPKDQSIVEKLKEPNSADTSAVSAPQVTGLEELPDGAPTQVQMTDDNPSAFKSFLRSHGWRPNGEQKKSPATMRAFDCLLITCCILSCNCCCGTYGTFECSCCGKSCNCACCPRTAWD